MPTRGDLIGTRFRNIVDVVYPAMEGERTFTTFTLRRVTATGTKDDLGETPTDFEPVVTAYTCVVYGLFQEDMRWLVTTPGQLQEERLIIWTSYADVREGDEVLIAMDGKTYLVESSQDCGTVYKCLLNSGKGRSG